MRRLILLVVTLAPLAGCEKAKKCDTCQQDSDCEAALVCSRFTDGVKRCSEPILSVCPAR